MKGQVWFIGHEWDRPEDLLGSQEPTDTEASAGPWCHQPGLLACLTLSRPGKVQLTADFVFSCLEVNRYEVLSPFKGARISCRPSSHSLNMALQRAIPGIQC